MTREEAKRILREEPRGNVMKRIEAVFIAEDELGKYCTIEDIVNWAEGKDEQNNKV